MAEYGCGISLMQSCAYDKERIKQALNGKLLCGEDENGFLYEEASKAECDEFILSAYDNCVYQLREVLISNKTHEKLLHPKNKIKLRNIKKYIEKRMEVEAEFNRDFSHAFESEVEE